MSNFSFAKVNSTHELTFLLLNMTIYACKICSNDDKLNIVFSFDGNAILYWKTILSTFYMPSINLLSPYLLFVLFLKYIILRN